MCQQSFKSKCTEYNASLKEIYDKVPESLHTEPEIKDFYGGMLDDLNAKYERLLSLFQQLLDNTKDIDREVSHLSLPFLSRIHSVRVERDRRRPWRRAREIGRRSDVRKLCSTIEANGFVAGPKIASLLMPKNQLPTFSTELLVKRQETCKR